MKKFSKLIIAAPAKGKITFDKDGWITMNGAPVRIDDEGNPVAGPANVVEGGEKSGSSSGKTFEDYKKDLGGDHYQAAQEFYKKELMGKPVKTSMGELGEQEVHFTGRNLKRIRMNMGKDPLKAEAVQHLPNVIKSGKYLGKTESYKEREDYDSFHHFQKQVTIAGKLMKMIVDVGHSPTAGYEFKAYNFMHSGAERYKEKVRHLKDWGLPAEDKKRITRSSLVKKTHERNGIPASMNIISPAGTRVNSDHLVFDRSSVRHVDPNGFLHVAVSNISKETVNPYYGHEIPGWREKGLDPKKTYYGYRSGRELEKAASTFNGLTLLKDHRPDSAAEPQKELRVGSLGTDARFVAPYLQNSLIITDAEIIAALNPADGEPPKRELSAAYRYEPLWQSGTFEGQRYDFIMTNIQGNHVALVEEGRAGPDVLVADEKPQIMRGSFMAGIIEELKKIIGRAEKEGVSPHPGGEQEAREFMEDDNGRKVAQDDEAGELGVRAFALLDSIEDTELADWLKSLVEGARLEQAETAADEEDPAREEVDEKAEEIAAEVEEVVKEVLGGGGPDPEGKVAAMDKKLVRKANYIVRQKGNTKVVVVPMAMDSGPSVPARLREIFVEAKRVAPLMGLELDPMAFDSADDIYAEVIRANGLNPSDYSRAAYKGMVDIMLKQRTEQCFPSFVSGALAMDHAGTGETAPQFKNLGRIKN